MEQILQNNTIKLRSVEPEDLELLYIWENNTDLWLAGNSRSPYSKFALKQYIIEWEKDIYESKQQRFMIDSIENHTTVGTVDLYDFEIHHSRISLGLFIDKPFQRKGYSTQTLHLIENYVFDFLNIHQLYCFIASNNTASCAMFEKENYLKSCCLKEWIKTGKEYNDIIVYQTFNKK